MLEQLEGASAARSGSDESWEIVPALDQRPAVVRAEPAPRPSSQRGAKRLGAQVLADEVLAEPSRCEIADLLDGARFLEEVTGSGDYS